jgi:hypothetical protein
MKMQKEFKKHIKLLAEKFNYEIEYEKDRLVLENNVNKIKIWVEDKYGTNVSFNLTESSIKTLKVKTESFYDILHEILVRTK